MVDDYRGWINQFDPRFSELEADVEHELQHFLYLWPMFESWSFDCDFQQREIAARAEHWIENWGNVDDDLATSITYFKSRYGRGQAGNNRFEVLMGSRRLSRENEALLIRFLADETDAPKDTLSALICIVYRLRNNLFHGEKLNAGISGQASNFHHANQVLISIMEQSRRYSSD